jgi:hypothetical protein
MNYEPTQPLRRPGGWQDQPKDQPAAEPDEPEYPPEPPTVGRPVFRPTDPPPAEPGPPGPAAPPAPPAQNDQPQYDQPQNDQPQYDTPQYGQGGHGQAPYDTPQYGQQQYDQPQYSQQYDQPPYGQQQQYDQPQTQPPAGGRRPKRRRRFRRSTMAIFTIIVVLILLLIGDRVANAIAENDMADQFTSNGFPVKPSVDITGFPFLTQLAARDFKKVVVTASNIPAGPVTINSLNATITGMHINGSFSGATIDQVNATAFVSFGSLAAAAGLGGSAGITMTPDGTDKVKITAGIGGLVSDTEVAEIKQTGPQQISVQLLSNGGGLGSVLSGFGPFTFNLPAGVPPSLRITSLTLNGSGLTIKAAATDATFSK